MALSATRNFCRGLVNCSNRRLKLEALAPSRQMQGLPLLSNINATRFYSKKSNQWVTVIFERHDGTRFERKGKVGSTVQELIGSDNPDFPGYGACDGTISCSTCHVILTEEDFKKLGKLSEEEEDTLELSPCLTNTSKLGCCITLAPDMDGMLLKLPSEVRDLRQS